MRYYDAPVLTGTTEEKLRQIEQFLFRHVNDLNHNLENTTPERFWEKTTEALTSSDTEASMPVGEEELRRNEYNALKALVIKSATAVLRTEDTFSQTLQGAYLAESDFGTFMEEGFVNINGSPYTVAQLYKYQSTILSGVNTYKTELEGYINTGVLEKGTDSPVFGIDIGYNKNTFVYNGTEYKNETPSKIRITPTKISFYEGSHEVAYMEKKAVYFPVAHIEGGSIAIGDNFSVDNEGNMKAANANITGEIKASSGYIGGFAVTGSNSDIFWPCSIASVINPSDEKTYQYAVFLRGNYTESGDDYGAIDTTHNVIGIKKRKKSSSNWQNDTSPYVFYVSVKGDVLCSDLKANGQLNGKYIKTHADRIAFGATGTDEYTGPIELLTNGDILLGKYTSKAKNIYLLASENIRIGQHSDNSSASSADNYPSTATVQIEAKTRIDIGSAPETADKTRNIYLNAIYTRSNGNFIPADAATYNLGHSDYSWNKAFIRHITSDGDIRIGKNSDTYSGNIYVETGGNLFLGHDDVPNAAAYIVAKDTVRIGQNNENLITGTVHIRGGNIFLKGNVYINGVLTYKQEG